MRLIRTLIAVPVLLAFGHGWLNAQEAPDRIFINGKIVTVDDYFSIHEAVAVRGERFVATGSSEEIRALAGDDTVVTDLGGRTVIPGLIDNHNHVIPRHRVLAQRGPAGRRHQPRRSVGDS